jgi:hypothetical protein
MEKYWEKEVPQEVKLGKNVLKIFTKAGKIQVFPRVPGSPNGVGRGTSLDLEKMTKDERSALVKVLTEAITSYKDSK